MPGRSGWQGAGVPRTGGVVPWRTSCAKNRASISARGRRFAILIVVACASFAFAAPPANAQSDSAWKEAFQACDAALDKGEFAAAEKRCTAAADEGAKFGASDLRLGISLAGMANLRYAQARYADARTL